MKRILVAALIPVLLVWSSTLIRAEPPIEPRRGGLPTCQKELAACLAQPVITFPGDGQTGALLLYEETFPPDGTFIDANTGLMWEIKLPADDPGCASIYQFDRHLRCVNNTYTWTADIAEPTFEFDGTAKTEFLDELNNAQFAGHEDWRLPTVKELQSLVDYSVGYPGPSVNEGLPGATRPTGYYWSSSAFAHEATAAWGVDFLYGSVWAQPKNRAEPTRAVRDVQ